MSPMRALFARVCRVLTKVYATLRTTCDTDVRDSRESIPDLFRRIRPHMAAPNSNLSVHTFVNTIIAFIETNGANL
jgi:hypothetical protein